MPIYDCHFKIRIPIWLDRLLVAVLLLYRRLRYGYEFRRIPLTRGKFAIVDADDYERLKRLKWHANGSNGRFYAVGLRHKKMHRLIMNAPDDKFVDHINGDGLDNRRANLRLATAAQNHWNCKYGMGIGTSRYKGVQWHKHNKKWVAVIGINGQRQHLGYYTNEKEAARAYDKAVKERRGQFAVLNFADS
jgi:hypothetical protein